MKHELDSYRAINDFKTTASEARRARIVIWIMGSACAVAFGMVLATSAYAHSAIPTAAKPQGWKYPFSCCSGYDCREVGDSRSQSKVKIEETPQGYRISSTGEILAYSDTRLKDSPDGEFHWCSVAGADDSRTICLFVPPRSY